MALKNQIIPCLWFDTQAEEAAQYYTSWEVVPKALPELLSNPDPERAKRAMNAMLKMKKFDIVELKQAAG